MNFDEILRKAAALGASDVHLKVGVVPVVRRLGDLRPLNVQSQPLSSEQMEQIVQQALTPREIEHLAEHKELDKSYEIKELGRFRMNVFRQRGSTRFVIRIISHAIPSFQDLHLPETLKYIAEMERGLVLVTGNTGSGKSTTLASMLNHVNMTMHKHIVTLEDPIEYFIRDRKSLVSQRELGIDMNSFASSIRATLRQDPDIIFVGEMRDAETIETVLLAAETGHLVLSTLHTTDAKETINRIITQFPPHHQQQIRLQLGSVLRAVISQRLVSRKDGKGLIPAVELMVNNERVREMIEDPMKTSQLTHAIATSAKESGMRSFDQSLMKLVVTDMVDAEEAAQYATSKENFYLRLKGVQSGEESDWDDDVETRTKLRPNWATKKETSNLELDNKKKNE
jgi:twitching motility protein PilT